MEIKSSFFHAMCCHRSCAGCSAVVCIAPTILQNKGSNVACILLIRDETSERVSQSISQSGQAISFASISVDSLCLFDGYGSEDSQDPRFFSSPTGVPSNLANANDPFLVGQYDLGWAAPDPVISAAAAGATARLDEAGQGKVQPTPRYGNIPISGPVHRNVEPQGLRRPEVVGRSIHAIASASSCSRHRCGHFVEAALEPRFRGGPDDERRRGGSQLIVGDHTFGDFLGGVLRREPNVQGALDPTSRSPPSRIHPRSFFPTDVQVQAVRLGGEFVFAGRRRLGIGRIIDRPLALLR